MMTDAQLKPCPFCGKPPVQFGVGSRGPFFKCGDVNCVAHDMGGMIAELWCTRADLSPVVKQLEWFRDLKAHESVTLMKTKFLGFEFEAWGGGAWTDECGNLHKADGKSLEAAQASVQAYCEELILSVLNLTQSDKDAEIERLRDFIKERMGAHLDDAAIYRRAGMLPQANHHSIRRTSTMTDTNELVKRLRDYPPCLGGSITTEAADEIERLQAELEAVKGKLAKAVEAFGVVDRNLTNLQPKIANGLVSKEWVPVFDGHIDPTVEAARTALAEIKGSNDDRAC